MKITSISHDYQSLCLKSLFLNNLKGSLVSIILKFKLKEKIDVEKVQLKNW
jgi:hypothetical protein